MKEIIYIHKPTGMKITFNKLKELVSTNTDIVFRQNLTLDGELKVSTYKYLSKDIAFSDDFEMVTYEDFTLDELNFLKSASKQFGYGNESFVNDIQNKLNDKICQKLLIIENHGKDYSDELNKGYTLAEFDAIDFDDFSFNVNRNSQKSLAKGEKK